MTDHNPSAGNAPACEVIEERFEKAFRLLEEFKAESQHFPKGGLVGG